MDTYTIDLELEHYYGDRMATGSKEASRRFYIRAVARCSDTELERYLRMVKAHASVYSSVHHMFRSPFKHMELPLLLSSVVLFIASTVMVYNGETSALVAGGISAGMVGALQCVRKLIAYWQKHAVREAVFHVRGIPAAGNGAVKPRKAVTRRRGASAKYAKKA